MTAVLVTLDSKTVATWKAKAALAGVVLSVTDDDRGQPLIVVSKWAMCHHLSANEVDAWLGRIGGPAA